METSGRDGDTYPSSKPGMITTEQLRGTNGIGTCVAERRPIEIIGAEHYLTVDVYKRQRGNNGPGKGIGRGGYLMMPASR